MARFATHNDEDSEGSHKERSAGDRHALKKGRSALERKWGATIDSLDVDAVHEAEADHTITPPPPADAQRPPKPGKPPWNSSIRVDYETYHPGRQPAGKRRREPPGQRPKVYENVYLPSFTRKSPLRSPRNSPLRSPRNSPQQTRGSVAWEESKGIYGRPEPSGHDSRRTNSSRLSAREQAERKHRAIAEFYDTNLANVAAGVIQRWWRDLSHARERKRNRLHQAMDTERRRREEIRRRQEAEEEARLQRARERVRRQRVRAALIIQMAWRRYLAIKLGKEKSRLHAMAYSFVAEERIMMGDSYNPPAFSVLDADWRTELRYNFGTPIIGEYHGQLHLSRCYRRGARDYIKKAEQEQEAQFEEARRRIHEIYANRGASATIPSFRELDILSHHSSQESAILSKHGDGASDGHDSIEAAWHTESDEGATVPHALRAKGHKKGSKKKRARGHTRFTTGGVP